MSSSIVSFLIVGIRIGKQVKPKIPPNNPLRSMHRFLIQSLLTTNNNCKMIKRLDFVCLIVYSLQTSIFYVTQSRVFKRKLGFGLSVATRDNLVGQSNKTFVIALLVER